MKIDYIKKYIQLTRNYTYFIGIKLLMGNIMLVIYFPYSLCDIFPLIR